MCIRIRQSGVTLVELIVFMLVIGVGVTGLLSAMSTMTKTSADPMLRKQALAIAESLLEEVELKNYVDPDGIAEASRELYDDLDDYAGFNMNAGIEDIYGNSINAMLDKFKATVTVDKTPSSFGPTGAQISAGEVALITVTVTDANGETISLQGYRSHYGL
jgi:MSHA pilin protein MshD